MWPCTFMYNARTICCDLASSYGGYKYKCMVVPKALLAKQTRSHGKTLSTLLDVKTFIVACYQGLLHVVCKVHSKLIPPCVLFYVYCDYTFLLCPHHAVFMCAIAAQRCRFLALEYESITDNALTV